MQKAEILATQSCYSDGYQSNLELTIPNLYPKFIDEDRFGGDPVSTGELNVMLRVEVPLAS